MARIAWQFRSLVQCELWPNECVDLALLLLYDLAMALLRGLFWLALFIFFTFCFIVLFEYGTHDFSNGFQKEFARVKEFVMQAAKPEKPKK